MMKQRLLKQLQHLQDAYSQVCGLTMIITDAAGNPLTARSEPQLVTQLLAERFLLPEQHSLTHILKDVSNINKPIVYQRQSGFKIIIAPVKVNNVNEAYIWSGVIIEKQNRALIERALGHSYTDNDQLREAVALTPDTSETQKLAMLDKLAQLADIASTLRQQASLMNTYDEHIHDINDFLLSDRAALQPSSLMERMTRILELDFAGYADYMEDERFRITGTTGGSLYEQLNGGEFTLGEGFLGQAGLTGTVRRWEHIAWDPRTDFFTERGVQPRELVCFPVKINNKLKGILFGGIVSESTLPKYGMAIGSLLINAFTAKLNVCLLEESKNQQMMRLSLLLEIAQTMADGDDIRTILHMLVDVSVSLVQGTCACVVIKQPGEAAQAHVVSKKLAAEHIEKYAKTVAKKHFTKKLTSPVPYRSPVMIETEWNRFVYEFPLICRGEVTGVLAVGLVSEEAWEQQRPFLIALSLLGEVILERSLPAVSVKEQPPNPAHSFIGLQPEPTPVLFHDNPLTPREKEVLALVMKGMSNLQIAQKLFISAHTVKNHITKIYEKLGVTDRTQAMAKMYSTGEQQRRA
ncbi:LuxR C-terminal-related transcriptional regulator [Paenibacillus sp. MBLB4367]|uniref:LuxR C-terminal-related transcriptional regulator n=1 Tax=Paenibacillus sp. MBLB4367 TaxID=3384767 RepID=UPI003908378A